MTPLTQDIRELYTLLGRMLDETLTEPQQQRLGQLLHDKPALIPYYVRFFRLSAELHGCLSRPEVTFSDPHLNLDIPAPDVDHNPAGRSPGHMATDQERIHRIRQRAEQQLQAFLAEQERQRKGATVTSRQRVTESLWSFSSLMQKADALVSLAGRSIVGLAAGLALIILLAGVIHSIHSQRVVATLTQSHHAVWETAPQSDQLRHGPMDLEQGYAELTFAHGARVLVQAPCRLDLLSPDRMAVDEGRVAAQVPPQAIGFTIDTSTSSITDFGTEFGVSCDDQIQTEVHVFKGRVQLRTPQRSPGHQNQWDLTKDRAAILDTSGKLELTSVQKRPLLFVRQLPQNDDFIPGRALNLADVVGRGNGLGTGILYSGLSLATGDFVGPQEKNVAARANGFIPTPGHDFIDGIFIPDSDNGSLVVTSTHLTYDHCPNTSGLCVHMIRDGALFQQGNRPLQPGRLRGVLYGKGGHPAIGMHANAGITFDLDHIRAVYPGSRITRFTSLAGISETVTAFTNGLWKGQRITVGFRVLVDGKERFSRILYAEPPQTAEINLPLQPTDRFLTLITLEGHPDRPFAWSLFGDPKLELTPVNP